MSNALLSTVGNFSGELESLTLTVPAGVVDPEDFFKSKILDFGSLSC